jgi:hypothetical protein
MSEHGAKRQVGDRGPSDGKLSTWVTVISAIIAVISAVGAIWSSLEAHETRIEDERPFLAVDVTPRPLDEPDPKAPVQPWRKDTFESKITAYGKTPALSARLLCAKVIVTGKPHIWDEKANHYFSVKVPYVLPARSSWMDCAYPDLEQQSVPDAQSIAEFGVLRYKSLSGEPYTTPFCEQISGNGTKNTTVSPCLEDSKIVSGLPPLK